MIYLFFLTFIVDHFKHTELVRIMKQENMMYSPPRFSDYQLMTTVPLSNISDYPLTASPCICLCTACLIMLEYVPQEVIMILK